MRYKVPRHVEYKAKILGPATFSQLLYIGAAGLVVLFLYFIIGTSPLFYILAIMIGGGGVALAFLQVAGQPLSEYIKKMILFSISSREYIWEKKTAPMETTIPKRIKTKTTTEEEESEKEEKAPSSKKGGRLDDISSKIETF